MQFCFLSYSLGEVKIKILELFPLLHCRRGMQVFWLFLLDLQGEVTNIFLFPKLHHQVVEWVKQACRKCFEHVVECQAVPDILTYTKIIFKARFSNEHVMLNLFQHLDNVEYVKTMLYRSWNKFRMTIYRIYDKIRGQIVVCPRKCCKMWFCWMSDNAWPTYCIKLDYYSCQNIVLYLFVLRHNLYKYLIRSVKYHHYYF